MMVQPAQVPSRTSLNRNRADNAIVKIDYHKTTIGRYFFADSTQTEEDMAIP